MRVLWSAYARTRREEIFDYISSDNADTALHLDESFSRCAGYWNPIPISGEQAE